jgi:hypothetical protein
LSLQEGIHIQHTDEQALMVDLALEVSRLPFRKGRDRRLHGSLHLDGVFHAVGEQAYTHSGRLHNDDAPLGGWCPHANAEEPLWVEDREDLSAKVHHAEDVLGNGRHWCDRTRLDDLADPFEGKGVAFATQGEEEEVDPRFLPASLSLGSRSRLLEEGSPPLCQTLFLARSHQFLPVVSMEPEFFTAEFAEIAEPDAIGPSFVQAGEKAFRL